MNPEAQRIAIAEFCGWKWYRRPATGPWAKKPMRALYIPELYSPGEPMPLQLADMTETPCNSVYILREGMIPDYCNDLNAAHEAENKAFPLENGCGDYYEALESLPHCEVFRATAPQRAKALLRTIGKWIED